MEEMKKLTIPEGYEFDRVENGEVILKKKEVVLPKSYYDCMKICDWDSFSRWSVNVPTPKEMIKPIHSLCQILICRNAWWKLLEWKPDWNNGSEIKFYIATRSGRLDRCYGYSQNHILSFPTIDVRDKFYEAFKDLIEEAKELL